MNIEEIEQLAKRAATGANGGDWTTHYDESQKEFWRQFVRDIGAAMVPEGYVIVPKKPTDAMICAALEAHEKNPSTFGYTAHYEAMIEARPK